MINILAWNVRGAGAWSFPHLIKDLKSNYRFQVLVILEPRVSGQRADKIIEKLDYGSSYRIEANGFSGGIWLLWDQSYVKIDIISATNQLLHSKLTMLDKGDSSLFTCVYGSFTPSIRQSLWSQLEAIHSSTNNSNWMCIGDFNSYKVVEDKQGVQVLHLIQ